jgi:hypothetical protein
VSGDQIGTESLLSEYLTKTRAAQHRAEHSEVVQRVEAIFDELGLPWQRDEDCWAINSDVGEVMAGLDDDEEVLSIWQVLFRLNKSAKKNGELMTRCSVRTPTRWARALPFGNLKTDRPTCS